MKINELKTPCYVIDEGKLTENLKILHHVMQRTGAKILLAQKAFSAFCEYPLIGKYLSGTTASGLYEARLAQEEMGKENHVFCPAYLPEEMDELVKICDHIVFNSVSQFLVHKEKIKEAAAPTSSTTPGRVPVCPKGAAVSCVARNTIAVIRATTAAARQR